MLKCVSFCFFSPTGGTKKAGGIFCREIAEKITEIDLTAGEYKLLCLFMENPGVVLSSEQILGRLWDSSGNFVDNNTLTVYIRRLRTKIEDEPSAPKRIITVRRMGYKWNVSD